MLVLNEHVKTYHLTHNICHAPPARKLASSHYEEAVSQKLSGVKDLGSRVGFLLGNSGVVAINAVIANDLGDQDSCQEYKITAVFSFCTMKYFTLHETLDRWNNLQEFICLM